MKRRDIRAATGERVRCKCCGHMSLVNWDGSVRGHRSGPHDGQVRPHSCVADSGNPVCRFHGKSKAEVAALHKRGGEAQTGRAASAAVGTIEPGKS